MKPKLINKIKIKNWLNDLSKDFTIVAPIKNGDNFDFHIIEDINDIAFDFDRTRMSAKSFFFIPEEELWVASMTNGSPLSTEPEPDLKVIFGLRPCDISALTLFDDVFSKDYNDPYFSRQREQNITIGLRCLEQCSTGFCGTMNSYNPMKGYDIMLTELPNTNYLVEIGSIKGKNITDFEYFTSPTNTDETIIKIAFQKIDETFKDDIGIVGIRTIMDLDIPQDMLDKYGEVCLSCGQCSFVCPTCWCFNIKDEFKLDSSDIGNLDNIKRTRSWTSCLYKEFHSISGAPPHVFKKTNSSRIEAYYKHKLRGVSEKYGVLGCVGCGRCFQSCPVGINPKATIETIMESKNNGND